MKFVNTRSFVNKSVNLLEIRQGRLRLFSRPVHITIEPTLLCNSNCVMCNRNAIRKEEVKRSGFLDWSVLKRLRPFLRWTERVLFGGFGEPLLHPEYISMLDYIKHQGPEVYFYTNGILLTPETSRDLIDTGIDQISISFGGGHPETYRRIRGVEMRPIVENLKALHAIRSERHLSKPEMTFNLVAMNSIMDEMDEIIRLAATLGVSEISMPNLTVQRPDLAHESPWMDVERSRRILSEAVRKAGQNGIRLIPPDLNESRGSCSALFKSLTVTWDGLILSCPMERFILADVTETPIQDIWNGPAMLHLRRRYLKEGVEHLCPNCFTWDNRPGAFLSPHFNSREFAEDLRKSNLLK